MRLKVQISDFRFQIFAWILSLVLCNVIPCQASEDLYESRLNSGLSNTEPYSYILMKKAAADSARAKELLEKAKTYSPDLPAIHFKLARENFSPSIQGIFQGFEHFMQGIKAYSRNFWWGFSIAGLIYLSLLISFVISMLIILVIRVPIEAGLLSHDISEDKWRLIMLAVIVFLSLLGPIAFIAGVFSLSGLYYKKLDKAVAYISIAFFLLSPVLLDAAYLFLSAPSPGLRAIVAVNEGRDNRYALVTLRDKDDFPSRFSYALALKREGHYGEAINIYKKMTGPPHKPDASIYVNLGNAYYAVNDMEAAKNSYRKSIDIAPMPSAFYNLSQVHRETLDFAKGDEYFTSAAKLNRESVSKFSSLMSPNPNRFVIDETLPRSAIWGYTLGQGHRSLSAITVIVAITMMAVFYFLDRKIKYRARRCKKCGAIFCGKCSRAITWDDKCSLCYRSLIKVDAADSRERATRLLISYQSQTIKRNTAKVLSFLIPGAGHIYSGRILSGLLFLWSFLLSSAVVVSGRFQTAGLYPFNHSWVMPFAGALMGLIYTLSVLHMRRGIRKGWL